MLVQLDRAGRVALRRPAEQHHLLGGLRVEEHLHHRPQPLQKIPGRRVEPRAGDGGGEEGILRVARSWPRKSLHREYVGDAGVPPCTSPSLRCYAAAAHCRAHCRAPGPASVLPSAIWLAALRSCAAPCWSCASAAQRSPLNLPLPRRCCRRGDRTHLRGPRDRIDYAFVAALREVVRQQRVHLPDAQPAPGGRLSGRCSPPHIPC